MILRELAGRLVYTVDAKGWRMNLNGEVLIEVKSGEGPTEQCSC